MATVFAGALMSMPLNVFVAEGNVEIYLAKLYKTWNPEERDVLLRLLAIEESQMGVAREHKENGERRVAEGSRRVQQQREVVAALPPGTSVPNLAIHLLETFEQTQELLEAHLQTITARFNSVKL